MSTLALPSTSPTDELGISKLLVSSLRRHFAFHFSFLLFILAQIVGFVHLLSTSKSPQILAILLASMVLSSFSYLIIHFFLQTKKVMRLEELRTTFVESFNQEHGQNEEHLHVANAAYRFASSLEAKEYSIITLPIPLPSLKRAVQKLSFFITWKDIVTMRELLLFVSVKEHVTLIKSRPTDLEAHASLANTYVSLARLYLAPTEESLLWTRRFFEKEHLQERFRKATEKALQEFEIIDTYAPDDPWVHAQLALCYHDLHMFTEETKAYETILQLCPDDKEVMFRLGLLYFRLGKNANGLRIYDKLLRLGYSRVERLLAHYDSDRLWMD